ncbi:LacI family DNA-binding transcriptional regulator [Ktedonobacter racemifer]|uniref:Transcriptional regulator, LacI family n=1 Tax=Ktedonobacter racemifer DSM 44963 TaxID=485913 RepID=D6TX70_KTERA|nr:LacI family DNA-binding transcriptional regulator [Ktedonobacter racemifer]EFH84803.1 transcriptional regulator, LacI family [Ktedonobacter racemifer DSM 44963]
MRIKLRDIAERAHVSTATVSRVLNNSASVDERTRAIVLQALTELGYPMYQEGILQHTGNGIVIAIRGVDSESEPEEQKRESQNISSFNTIVIDGIERVLRRKGLHMSLRRAIWEAPAESDLHHLTQADGVVLIGGIISVQVIDALEQANVPFVLTAAHVGEREINCVLGDYIRGAAQATTQLVRLGHRRIAFINGPSITTTSQDKLAGYRLGLCEAGLAYDAQLITTTSEFTPNDGYQSTQDLLARTRDFSAILYAADMLAIGGLRALKEANIPVPEQVSVMGFYDEPITEFTMPTLSSVHIGWQRIGEIAAQRLVVLLERHDEERLRISIPTTVILRDSTRSVGGNLPPTLSS